MPATHCQFFQNDVNFFWTYGSANISHWAFRRKSTRSDMLPVRKVVALVGNVIEFESLLWKPNNTGFLGCNYYPDRIMVTGTFFNFPRKPNMLSRGFTRK